MTAGEFMVLAVSEAGVTAYGGNGYQVFQMTAGNFSNSGEALSLQDAFGNVVNAIDYDDAAPWASEAMGILGNNYIETPDGGCASLEYTPEILALYLDTPTGNGNDLGGNWQASWVDNGTPGAANSSAFGCNNPQACNFDANANSDDGSCDFISCLATGCTDATACNYDMEAQVNDGTCSYPVAGRDCGLAERAVY